MTNSEKHKAFIAVLKVKLPTSDAAQRTSWANKIIAEKIPISSLWDLLLMDKEIALRCSWLLSDIAAENKAILFDTLPFLFDNRELVQTFDFEQSFATYWSLVGVPQENETAAIDLILAWLQSPLVNVTTKSRALIPLEQLATKYPELKYEIRIVLEGELMSSNKQLQKRIQNLLERFS